MVMHCDQSERKGTEWLTISGSEWERPQKKWPVNPALQEAPEFT